MNRNRGAIDVREQSRDDERDRQEGIHVAKVRALMNSIKQKTHLSCKKEYRRKTACSFGLKVL